MTRIRCCVCFHWLDLLFCFILFCFKIFFWFCCICWKTVHSSHRLHKNKRNERSHTDMQLSIKTINGFLSPRRLSKENPIEFLVCFSIFDKRQRTKERKKQERHKTNKLNSCTFGVFDHDFFTTNFLSNVSLDSHTILTAFVVFQLTIVDSM